MKVLHFSESIQGGIASYLDEIAEHQIEKYGSENVLFFIPEKEKRYLSRVPERNISTFIYHHRELFNLVRMAFAAIYVCASFRPDIVHLHSTFSGLLFRSVTMLFIPRCKVVYCAHGWAFARDSSRAMRRVSGVVERLLMNNTDHCINISNTEAAAAASYGLGGSNFSTIPNGISDLTYPPTGSRNGAGAVELLFVGRHDYQKGLDLLLDAMGHVRHNLHLTVLGENVVNAKTSNRPGLPNVTFAGWIPREQVAERMRAADAVVVPSRWEGFGFVVIEAMRSARAVIASNRGHYPRL